MDRVRVLTSSLPISFILISLLYTCQYVKAHGRLWEPPGRSTMWRRGFPTPRNYQDNQLFCGGAYVQYLENEGKCGVCGDPYNGVRENEVNGKYARGIVVKNYTQGEQIEAEVQLTANHLGWFMFSVCPKKKYNDPEPLQCFEDHPLEIVGMNGTYKFPVSGKWSSSNIKVQLQLPKDISCPFCVFRWKYHAGNSWGTDPITKVSCVGCGNQEEFYGCADIRIYHDPNADPSHSISSLKNINLSLFISAMIFIFSFIYDFNINCFLL
ncbi:uncharacterized protein LOC115214156 [Argonauta hians]